MFPLGPRRYTDKITEPEMNHEKFICLHETAASLKSINVNVFLVFLKCIVPKLTCLGATSGISKIINKEQCDIK